MIYVFSGRAIVIPCLISFGSLDQKKKIGILKNSTSKWRRNHQFIKKNWRSNFFSKLQNGGAIQDGATNHCFILSSVGQSFSTDFNI
jgi:hypothetical protein